MQLVFSPRPPHAAMNPHSPLPDNIPDTQSREEVFRYVKDACAARSLAMTRLTKEIIQLNRIRNSVVPISILPAEIFMEIFSYLVDPGTGGNALLVRATHVCSQWRTIALGVAKLWTKFHIHNFVATDQFLRRSRSLPVSLTLSHTGSTFQAIASLVGPHVHRIRSLRLSGNEMWRLRGLLSRLRAPAPKLEELFIEQQTSYLPIQNFPLMTGPLFHGVLPSLRTLVTIDVNITVQIPVQSSLVHLVIRNNKHIASKTLLDFLERCPLLETFELSGYHAFDPDVVPARHNISLVKLKLLQLNLASSSRTAALLSHLSVPQSTRLLIDTRNDRDQDNTTEGYPMLPPHAHTHLKCLTSIQRLDVLFENKPLAVTLCAYRHRDRDQAPDEPADILSLAEPDIQISFSGPWPQEALFRHWPFDVSQVEALTVLGIDRDGPFPWTAWKDALLKFGSLRCLRVVDTRASLLVSALTALAATQGGDDGEGERLQVCPELTRLELFDVHDHGFERGAYAEERLSRTILTRLTLGKLKEVDMYSVAGLERGALLSRLKETGIDLESLVVRTDDADI